MKDRTGNPGDLLDTHRVNVRLVYDGCTGAGGTKQWTLQLTASLGSAPRRPFMAYATFTDYDPESDTPAMLRAYAEVFRTLADAYVKLAVLP